jgi:hypothetical protein
MRNITQIQRYGKASLTKAHALKPRAYRRKAAGCVAFTVKSSRADGPSYIVRLAIEGRAVLGDCVEKATGRPCKGFSRQAHCYHVGAALLVTCCKQ